MNNPITHILTKLETLLGKTPEKDVTTSLLLRLAFYYEAMSVFPETFKGPITFGKIGQLPEVLKMHGVPSIFVDNPEWNLCDVYTDTEPLEWDMGMGSTLEGILDGFKTRSSYGAHYTPQSLVDEVVRAAWRPLFEYHWRQVGGDPEAYIQKLRTLTACDPAMGAGYFLRTVAFELAKEIVYVRIKGRPQPFDWHEYTLHPDSTGMAIQACGVGFMESVQKELPLVLPQCYGVDIHPLAVEVSKLTLWLYARDLSIPLTFMDSNLLCGDALLGTWAKDLKFSGVGRWPYDATLLLEFYGRRLTIPLEESNAEIMLNMVNHLPGAHGRTHRALHWELAFPSVFPLDKLDRGFDLIVANPPFIGDRDLRGRIGEGMVKHLSEKYTEGKTPEYAGLFLLKYRELGNPASSIGTIGPNSVCQASNRDYITFPILNENLFTIHRAMPNRPWPGDANVHYCLIHMVDPSIFDGTYRHIVSEGDLNSDKWKAEHPNLISSYLDVYPDAKLHNLPTMPNTGLALTGMFLRGNFAIHREQNDDLLTAISKVPINERSALAAFITNRDVQQNAIPTPSDVVIDFFEPLKAAGKDKENAQSQEQWLQEHFPTLFAQLQTRSPHTPDKECVFETRAALESSGSNDPHKEFWWLFGSVRHGLRDSWKGREYVMAFGRVTKIWSPPVLPTKDPILHLRLCPMDKIFVSAESSPVWIGLTLSFLFEQITRRQCGTLESRLNFSPTDVFPFLPVPWKAHFKAGTCELTVFPIDEKDPKLKPIAAAAESLIEIRTNLLANPKSYKLKIGKKWGPTELYNLYDDEEVENAGIEQLRQAHVDLQQSVLHAYGWDDLATRCSRENWVFDRPWIDRTPRFVPPENVRREIYVRMGELNATRYQEELTMFLDRALTVMKGNKYMSLKDIAKAMNTKYCTADLEGKNEVDIAVLEEALKLGVTTGTVENHQRGYLPSCKAEVDFSHLFFGS